MGAGGFSGVYSLKSHNTFSIATVAGKGMCALSVMFITFSGLGAWPVGCWCTVFLGCQNTNTVFRSHQDQEACKNEIE